MCRSCLEVKQCHYQPITHTIDKILNIFCFVVELVVKDAMHKPSVCISGYPLSGYPDLSVNFMAAKYQVKIWLVRLFAKIGYYVHFMQFLVLLVFTYFGVINVHVSLSVSCIICDFE